ncbi:MAG: hypothetical protein KJO01_09090 [Gammaproteobacteria bacterium]|nr:hypothetical protein [Gammaproteobacteria bacterium]MBT8110935.1 hypothetical protein [Gammaproteobacteria bacterium]NND47368.1 hypothetical protein [Woeseiaceae bacterium]NNL45633.1 hypothetical protein [Woeseiaceae bacterium]
MRKFVIVVTAIGMVAALFTGASVAVAQTSAAEMLEQARARAREMEELKAVLNGPDQNMRLASFDIMVNSGDEAMRQIAIDTGLASADTLMQAMAFKESVLSLNRIVMSLEIDKSQPADIQVASQKILDANGNAYELPIAESDKKTGIFKIYSNNKGQVSGLELTFKYSYDSGRLSLVDETTMKGPVRIYKGGYGNFIATAKIR